MVGCHFLCLSAIPAMSEQLRPDELMPHIRPSSCDHRCQNYGAQAKIMGCSTLTKIVRTLHLEAVVTGSFCGPVQSWASWQALAVHKMVEEQLLLGPTAESGQEKCPLMRNRSLVIAD